MNTKFNKHTCNTQSGAALVVVLILTIIISATTVAMANKSRTDILIAKNDLSVKQALFVANAGLSHAYQYLENTKASTFQTNFDTELVSDGIGGGLAAFGTGTQSINGKQYRTLDFGDGQFFVRIEDNFDDGDQTTDSDEQVWLHSIGQVDKSERELHALVRARHSVPGVFGKSLVSMTGNSNIDSYNGGTYDPLFPSADATVGSNVSVDRSGSFDLYGNIESGGTSTVSGGSSTVSGTNTTNAAQISLEPVTPCTPDTTLVLPGYDPLTGNIVLSGSDNLILTDSNYCFNFITMSSSSKITTPNGVNVTITMNGVLDMAGGEISNESNDAAFLTIRSSYNGSWVNNLRGGSKGYFSLYAPDASFKLVGSAEIFGTVIADQLELGGSGTIHVDNSLTAFSGFQLLAWREVRR